MQYSSKAQAAISVAELNHRAKQLLEGELGQIWVCGEISNFSRPSSGHWYFTLKDQQAQIRCAMFRGRNGLVRHQPKAGDQVIIRGKISLYEPRGDYQLIADSLRLAGEGLLQQQFEQLKQRLHDEGLFAPEWKKPLPEHSQRIAVISSATGAALQDILTVLKRRDPGLEVILIPASVQGAQAPSDLLYALRIAEQLDNIDTILIGRGGGSLEDLWAFNDEQLARAIFACQTPIVSAVGHEIDFSICDFVADVRAPTPSAAAELISRDSSQDRIRLQHLSIRLRSAWLRFCARQQDQLQQLSKQLKHPGEKIEQWQQRCDRAENSLTQAISSSLEKLKQQLIQNQRLLISHNPGHGLPYKKQKLIQLNKRLNLAAERALQHKQQSIAKLAAELDLVSPLATLSRGYSIVRDKDNKIVRSIKQLKTDTNISIQLDDGQAQAVIQSTNRHKLTNKN
ncbi:exodeoxyribonuclease VII large subunit [Agaribacterium sp. ZY112]|uniref:exodeoxyribonuclease VII large subunit n=1 Tax=Agaribacterium sp. ZY112 TaxID=3233574 RepID=UPI0035268EB1